VATPEPFPVGWQSRWHVATPEPSHIGRRVWSHETRGSTGALLCWVAGLVARGDARALPHREAGLEPRDTCRHRSPSMSSGVLNAMGHMAMPELSDTGSGSGATGTRDDTGAYQV
jgi:hypothetical protein